MNAVGSGASEKKISRLGMKPAKGSDLHKASASKIDAAEPKKSSGDQFETADGPVPVQSSKKSSRRMSAVSSRSGISSASASKRSSGKEKAAGRSERSEREERGARGSGGSGGGNNTMIIGGVVAVLVLIVLVGLSMGGGAKKSAKEAKTPAKIEELTDRTPSGDWARRGADLESKGDKQGAMNAYNRAAEAAQREGSSSQAQQYGMRAYQIQKFTKLTETR